MGFTYQFPELSVKRAADSFAVRIRSPLRSLRNAALVVQSTFPARFGFSGTNLAMIFPRLLIFTSSPAAIHFKTDV
jgi:hypothetical protein